MLNAYHRFVRSMAPILIIVISLLLVAPVKMADADMIVVRDGGCTLVDAIHAANTDTHSGKCPAGNGADTILITKDVVLSEIVDTTNGNNGLPSITSDITIQGNGLEIRREAAPGVNFRLFHIASTGTLTLEHIIVRGGTLLSPIPDGAGIYIAGGILNINFAKLLNNSTGAGRGGAIYNEGGTISMWQSEISASGALAGGAIYIGTGGHVDIEASTINGGTPYLTAEGTAIFNDDSSSVSIEHSFIDGIYNAGEMSVTNSRVTGYRNDNGFIDNRAGGHITLNFTTLINNTGLGYTTPTIYNEGTLELNNSILYNALASECYGSGAFSGSNNLGSSNSCPGVLDLLPTDSVSLQQHLFLADGHIGSTSSYAYNRLGDCGLLDTDYFPRDVQCDIGAYEYTGPAITGRVWQDFNGIGTISQSGIDDVIISLHDAAASVIATTVTANGGRYWFENIAPGTYTVAITLPDGYVLTDKHYVGAGQMSDSDGDPDTGITDPIVITPASNAVWYQSDFGIYQPVTMSGIVFEDTNQNGEYDPGENPLSGVEIFAYRVEPSRTYTSFTNSDGAYLFTGMLPGLYDITFELDPDYYLDGPVGVQSVQTLETSAAVMDVSRRNIEAALLQTSASLTLEVHVVSRDNGSMQMDFGFLKASPPNAPPARNLFTTNFPTLTWNRITWATEYEIQVDSAPTFTTPLSFTRVVPSNTLEVTTTVLPDGTYYWRVRAKKPDGAWGGWSAVDSFAVDAP